MRDHKYTYTVEMTDGDIWIPIGFGFDSRSEAEAYVVANRIPRRCRVAEWPPEADDPVVVAEIPAYGSGVEGVVAGIQAIETAAREALDACLAIENPEARKESAHALLATFHAATNRVFARVIDSLK